MSRCIRVKSENTKVVAATEKYLLNYVFFYFEYCHYFSYSKIPCEFCLPLHDFCNLRFTLFTLWFLCFAFCIKCEPSNLCCKYTIIIIILFVIFVFVFCVIHFLIFVFCVILFLIFVFCVLRYPLCDFCVRNLSPSASVCVVTLPTLHNLADISGRHSAFVFVNFFVFVFVRLIM